MTIDNVQSVVDEFVKRLQLPESRYSFAVNNGNDSVELIIFVDDEAKCALGIGNGTVRIVYDDKYDSDKYSVQKFLTPITLLYYLCMFFFISVSEVFTLTFNDLLSVVLMNEIYDWKTLVQGLAENTGLTYSEKDDATVLVNDVEIHYSGFTNIIRIDTQEIKLQDNTYTTAVEAMFKTVEYIANIMGVADDFFGEQTYEEEANIIGEELGESETPEMNLDMDIDMGEGESESAPEPVEPMENETFEEPQGPVVTVNDLIE